MVLDTYLFREWLSTFLLASTAIIGLLLLSEIYKDLFDLVEAGVSLPQIVRYFLLLIPGYLPTLLPITFLISLLFCLGNLQKNSEIVAMRAAGISLLRLSRPFWFSAFLLATLLLWLNAWLVPTSMESARDLLESTERQVFEDGSVDVDFRARAMGIVPPDGNELWFVEAYDRNKQIGYGISIHLLEDARERGRITATQAAYQPENGTWLLKNGFLIQYEETSALPEKVTPFEQHIWQNKDITPELLLGLSRRPKDLSLRELAQLVAHPSQNAVPNAYIVQYYNILTSPLLFIVIVLIALPVALGNGRIKPSAGVSRTVWTFAALLLLISLFSFAGERGLIPPLLATLLPMLLAFAYGVVQFRRNA